jgi:hypothetical protein
MVGAMSAAVVIGIATFVVIVLGHGDKPGAQAETHGDPPPPPAATMTFTEPTPSETATPETTATQPTATQPTEADALAELQRLSEQGLSTVSLNGRYVAQIASKYPGITDPLQTTPAGSHMFRATDILDEHTALLQAHDSPTHPIILLKSTDYGKRQTIGTHPLWVTFATGDFADKQAVRNWCNARFPELTAAQRENQCAVRRLEPGR